MNKKTLTITPKDGGIMQTQACFELETNYELINKANLGKKKQICKLCGAKGDFQTWLCTENYFGYGDEFNYFECPECETLQIESVPENMKKYYPHNYPGFAAPRVEPVRMGAVVDKRAILDIGCGSGGWLCYLATIGCINLSGCDPFIDKDITYSNGVKIKKATIHDMQGKYDIIHFSNSFGHLTDPDEAFRSFDRLLKRENDIGEEPKVELFLPLFPNAAFDIYGPYWYQVDAPRHFMIHSMKSLEMLSDKHGFKITNVNYNDFASSSQFITSRMFQFGIPLSQWQQRFEYDSMFASLREQSDMLDALAKCAAVCKRSDQAMITLTRV